MHNNVEDDYMDAFLEDDCFHEDYEADILTGIATCPRCGYRWMLTSQQREQELAAHKSWEKMCVAWEEHEKDLPVRCQSPDDDGLPF